MSEALTTLSLQYSHLPVTSMEGVTLSLSQPLFLLFSPLVRALLPPSTRRPPPHLVPHLPLLPPGTLLPQGQGGHKLGDQDQDIHGQGSQG